MILPVLLCGCENWSVTLREEHSLRAFKNRELWHILRREMQTGFGGRGVLKERDHLEDVGIEGG
jgi:hypothetical protein